MLRHNLIRQSHAVKRHSAGSLPNSDLLQRYGGYRRVDIYINTYVLSNINITNNYVSIINAECRNFSLKGGSFTPEVSFVADLAVSDLLGRGIRRDVDIPGWPPVDAVQGCKSLVSARNMSKRLYYNQGIGFRISDFLGFESCSSDYPPVVRKQLQACSYIHMDLRRYQRRHYIRWKNP